MALRDKFTQPARDEPRFFPGFFEFRQIVIAGFIVRRPVIASAFESQQQLRARRRIFGEAEFRAVFRRAELQSRPGVVTHTADFLAHEQLKNGIHKTEQALATAKIFGKGNGLTVAAMPGFGVIAKDFRVGQTKAIDALFYIAHEETVRFRTVASKRLDDFVLRGVDVLIFVHEHEPDFFAPLPGNRCWFVRAKIPEQLQGELLQIVKIQNPVVAFARRESRGKMLCQLQQRAHGTTYPIPILGKRVAVILDRGERIQKLGVGKKFLQWFAESGFFARRIIGIRS